MTPCYLFAACSGMTPARARQVLGLPVHGAVKRPDLLAAWKNSELSPRHHAAKDVLIRMADSDPEDETDASDDLKTALSNAGVPPGTDWKIVGFKAYPTITYLVGNTSSGMIAVGIQERRTGSMTSVEYVVDGPEKVKAAKDVQKAIQTAVNAIQGESSMRWILYPGGKLTETTLNRINRKSKTGSPLRDVVKGAELVPAKISESKTIPTVLILKETNPAGGVWADLHYTAEQVEEETARLKKERDRLADKKDPIQRYLRALLFGQSADSKPNPHWPEYLQDEPNRIPGIVKVDLAKYGIRVPDFSTMTVEAIKAHREEVMALYEALDAEYLAVVAQRRAVIYTRDLADTTFTLSINGKNYPLAIGTVPKLHDWLNLAGLDSWNKDRVDISKVKKVNPYEVLRAIEDALTSEPTELFIRLHQVIEWFEDHGKATRTASRQDQWASLVDRLLARDTTENVATQTGFSVSALLRYRSALAWYLWYKSKA